MRAYAMQGTPTTVLIDAHGRLRQQIFGVHDDLLLGAELGMLRKHAAGSTEPTALHAVPSKHPCVNDSCAIG
jgi:hypothetical protein